MRDTLKQFSLAAAVLLALSPRAGAQVAAPAPAPAPAPARLTFGALPADLRSDAVAALAAMRNSNLTEAYNRANAAVTRDSTFGLARGIRAFLVGGPTRADEMRRALADATRLNAANAAVVLSLMYPAQAPLREAAAKMAPGDTGLAFDHAQNLVGAARINALRELTARYPTYVPAKLWLAYWLAGAVNTGTVVPPANVDEALRVAQEALQLAPTLSAAHTMMGHVLQRLGRDDEAVPHLNHAVARQPVSNMVHFEIAEVAVRNNRWAQARGALDTAAMIAPDVAQKVDYARIRDFMYLAEGSLQAAMTGLARTARDAEAKGLILDAMEAHVWMAHALAANRDGAGAEQHMNEARRLGATPLYHAQQSVYAYATAGDGPRARVAFTEYMRVAPGDTSAAGPPAPRMFHGLTLLAEKKGELAIAQLAPLPPGDRYIALGLIEAFRVAGRTADATAARNALLARKDVPYRSTVFPIVRYWMVTGK
jgi:tetratricopeptide (TPR) repeat protein